MMKHFGKKHLKVKIFRAYCLRNNILPGIKVDEGLMQIYLDLKEKINKSAGIRYITRERIKKYAENGAACKMARRNCC